MRQALKGKNRERSMIGTKKGFAVNAALRMLCIFIVAALVPAFAQTSADGRLRTGARIYINEMPDDFHTYLKAALTAKKVPLNVVPSRDQADFEIKGSSETQKAGAAKKAILLNWHSDEQASISISNIKSGEIVFAYSVNKKSSAHGKQSTAEACAKHLKDELEKTR
jgi:hypothetical protein